MGRTQRKRRRRATPSNTISGPMVPKSLITWSLSNGLKMSNITPKMFPGCGRGLRTTRDIHPPHVVITVPLQIMITFDNVCSCPKMKKVMAHGKMKAKDTFMLFLLTERCKGERSFYFHYIKNLPPAHGTSSYTSNADTQLLPSFLSEQVHQQKQEISDAFVRISRTLKLCSKDLLGFNVTLHDVRWAWNVINTRSVFFDTKHLKCRWDVDVSDVNFALLPILDLLNHHSTADIDVKFNDRTNELQIITNDSYKRGEQVFINYGAHSNRALLCEYGFVLPNNIHSQVPLPKELLLKHTAKELDSSLVESLTASLIQTGVSLNKMCLTRDGFDWSFLAAVHTFHSYGTNEHLQCNGLVVEKCVGPCSVNDVLRRVLLEMIEQHYGFVRNIQGKGDLLSPILESVLELLKMEIHMMKEWLLNISNECLLE